MCVCVPVFWHCLSRTWELVLISGRGSDRQTRAPSRPQCVTRLSPGREAMSACPASQNLIKHHLLLHVSLSLHLIQNLARDAVAMTFRILPSISLLIRFMYKARIPFKKKNQAISDSHRHLIHIDTTLGVQCSYIRFHVICQ